MGCSGSQAPPLAGAQLLGLWMAPQGPRNWDGKTGIFTDSISHFLQVSEKVANLCSWAPRCPREATYMFVSHFRCYKYLLSLPHADHSPSGYLLL